VALVSTVTYLLADAGDVSSGGSASDTSSGSSSWEGSCWCSSRSGLAEAAGGGGGGRSAEVDVDDRHADAGQDGRSGRPAGGGEPRRTSRSLAAGASLAQAGVSGGEAAVGLIVFVAIASVGIIVPVVAYLAGGERAAGVLDGWKTWLSTNSTAMMAVVFLVFGAVLFTQGLRGLT
jgi:hypothetical protein